MDVICQIQILVETVSISLRVNSLMEGINPVLLSPTLGKIVTMIVLSLDMVTGLKYTGFKSTLLR